MLIVLTIRVINAIRKEDRLPVFYSKFVLLTFPFLSGTI